MLYFRGLAYNPRYSELLSDQRELMTNDPKTKAVLVAKDVLEQLDALTFEAGRYFYVDDVTLIENITDDLQDCVDEVQKHCKVCARGALVLSKARLFNEVPLMDYVKSNDTIRLFQYDTTDLLKDVWDEEQLDLIEAAFEGDPTLLASDVDRDLIDEAVVFGGNYDTRKDRLAAIMENIIENNGVFVP